MSSAAPQPLYGAGDRVILLSDRSKVGTVLGDPRRANGFYWYRVELPSGQAEVVPEDDLERYQASRKPEDLFRERSFGDRDDFLRLVTFEKLNTPLDNTLYALRGSRTEFYPHQYKPLVKFLDSQEQRLLIADEVGLGKTIEAGFILIEQRARDSLRQVMIVCPAALCLKWREEMWRRFDEKFTILKSADFRGMMADLENRGELGDFRYIISLQSLRQQSNLELLEALRLPLSLLIVDEAHHCRNPSANQHRVVAALSEYAEAVLLLTATPIHLGAENLYHLFRILSPAEFESLDTFQEQLEANAPVVEAQRLLQVQYPPPMDEVAERILQLGSGGHASFFAPNPIYRRLAETVPELHQPTRNEVVHLQRDVEDLNLLGHIFTRTRKREVFENPPVRSPQVYRPTMAPEEREFYHAVTEFVREGAEDQMGSLRYFAVMSAQRQIASCMQAVKEKFLSKAGAQFGGEDPEESDLESGVESDVEGSTIVPPSRRVIDAAGALGHTDTKYEALKAALRELEKEEPGRKIILFAYFKGTLRYLNRRLRADGFDCVLVHGDIKSSPDNPEEDERGKRMRAFKHPDGPQILLSSEVSSEGLDFQFCHILMNYDLPWNPMRVEQRIGRLDRLGQQSEKIVIVNFSVPDTIEDRILSRLYDRIGIFRESIGDLEAILGDAIQTLTHDLLSRQLTPEEEEARIEQAAMVIEARKRDFEKLEQESGRFVGHDAYFRDELARVQAGGEFLTPEDCETFFRGYLERFCSRSKLSPSRDPRVFHLTVAHDLESAIRGLGDDPGRSQFLQRLGRGEVDVTFDSAAAFHNDEVEFLRLHHPLMRCAVEAYRDHKEMLHPVSALALSQSEQVPVGSYLYGLYRVTITGGRERVRLEPIFARIEGTDLLPIPDRDGSLLLGELLRSGQWGEARGLSEADAGGLLEELNLAFLGRLGDQKRDMEERNAARVEQRLASLAATHETAIGKKKQLLEQAHRKGQAPRYIRMLEGTIRRMRGDYEDRRAALHAEKRLATSCQLVACGLLHVGSSDEARG